MTYTPPKKKHWQKFNFRDWMTDEKLLQCSRGARSLWLDMCGLIYAAEDRGRLIIDGQNPDHLAIAHRLGDHGTAVKNWLAELENAGVFVRDDENFIVSKRIFREILQAQKSRDFGKLGGNPALVSKDKHEGGVNTQSQSQSQSKEALAARGVILSVTGPGMLNPEHNPSVQLSLDRVLDHWLATYDLNLDIVPVVRARTAKVPNSGKRIRAFQYLEQAIAEHHRVRTQGLFAGQPSRQPKQKSEPQPATGTPTDEGYVAIVPAPNTPPPKGKARTAAFAIVEVHGQAAFNAWFRECTWNGAEVFAPNEFFRSQIDTRFGGTLREEGFRVVLGPDPNS